MRIEAPDATRLAELERSTVLPCVVSPRTSKLRASRISPRTSRSGTVQTFTTLTVSSATEKNPTDVTQQNANPTMNLPRINRSPRSTCREKSPPDVQHQQNSIRPEYGKTKSRSNRQFEFGQ